MERGDGQIWQAAGMWHDCVLLEWRERPEVLDYRYDVVATEPGGSHMTHKRACPQETHSDKGQGGVQRIHPIQVEVMSYAPERIGCDGYKCVTWLARWYVT